MKQSFQTFGAVILSSSVLFSSWGMSSKPAIEEPAPSKAKAEQVDTQLDSSSSTAVDSLKATVATQPSRSDLRLIPHPSQVQVLPGQFSLHTALDIVLSDGVREADVKPALEASLWLDPKSPLKAMSIKPLNAPGVIPGIVFVKDPQLGGEAYQLKIEDQVRISASNATGWLYGLQSLKQLLVGTRDLESPLLKTSAAVYTLPQVMIQDQPSYHWRSVMVDVSRHFFSIEALYKLLDRMSYYKLNTLHLHLSDDQGWRMEIQAYPQLTKHGGSSEVGGGPGGYYTQEELKKFIQVAQTRGIQVIPEFDMPGHVYAALSSLPELNCADGSNIHPNDWEPNPPQPPALYTGTKVGWNKLCLTAPATYEFFSQVMKEVADVFPSQYIHVGGDEIKDTLFQSFIHYADSVIRSHDKVMIGWEEVLEADVGPKTIGQIWRRIDRGAGRRLALEKKSPVILSPCENFYLDHANVKGQAKTMDWCTPDVTLEDVYSYEEHPELNVIGFEAPVWSEFVETEADLDNRLFPRILALSERTWTPAPLRDYSQFEKQVQSHSEDMKSFDIQYYGR